LIFNTYDATDLLNDLHKKKISVRKGLEDCLARINKYNQQINAIVYIDVEGARRAADKCDLERKNSTNLPPLHGIPVTIKECFDWKDHPTTLGDTTRKNCVAKSNSAVVENLKKSGAIILGKTNVPKYLRDWETYNSLFGETRNPHDYTKSAGGSSGGSAAAVAMGFSYADVGTDMGGSIRLPSHYCGVYGLKPTWNTVAMKGHYGSLSKRNPDINVAGPITRSPRDLLLFYNSISNNLSIKTLTQKLTGSKKNFLKNLSFAVMIDDKECPIDKSYQNELYKFIRILEKNGIKTDLKARPNIDLHRFTEIMNFMVRAETSTYDELLNITNKNISHKEWLLLNEEKLDYNEKWIEFFDKYDFLLCPSGASAAPNFQVLDNVSKRKISVNGKPVSVLSQHFWFSFASLGGLPACSFPIGKTNQNLPVGIQIISKPFFDKEIIQVSNALRKLINLDKKNY